MRVKAVRGEILSPERFPFSLSTIMQCSMQAKAMLGKHLKGKM
jgi:hypothetical protein